MTFPIKKFLTYIILTFLSFFYCCNCLYANTIKVGTTGDYLPFSSYNFKNKQFTGKDISLIKQFAKAEDYKIKFIKTNWSSISSDMKVGKFSIFVGGITINKNRLKSFLFSIPLISFSKAAMTQCKNINKYKSWSDIDNSNNFIVENHGGTNEKFALSKIHNANILILSDNTKALNSLEKGIDGIYPNIMFTDTLEINYLHKSVNKNLCMIKLKIDNNIKNKAFMFANTSEGQKLVLKFNNWLKKKPKVLIDYRKNL